MTHQRTQEAFTGAMAFSHPSDVRLSAHFIDEDIEGQRG